MPKKVRSTPTSMPTSHAQSTVEKCEQELAKAHAAYAAAQDRLGELQLKYVGSESEESVQLLAAAHGEIERIERTLVGWESAVQKAKVQHRAEVAKMKVEKQAELWDAVEKDGSEMLDLAKKADDYLDKALEIFWQLIPLGNKLYQTAPANDGTSFNDSPIGDIEIQGYFRKHLRKRMMTWAYPHFEDQVETLPTISGGVEYGLQWLHKENPRNPYRAKDEQQ